MSDDARERFLEAAIKHMEPKPKTPFAKFLHQYMEDGEDLDSNVCKLVQTPSVEEMRRRVEETLYKSPQE